ncbi:uncharacterized protein [Elaeis guineensis]|uniref:uncharacterized protein isoform X2 n=1 Tax=Elaeis guineensis var. tenera TaxID=51953 RepID=UPI003C6D27A7
MLELQQSQSHGQQLQTQPRVSGHCSNAATVSSKNVRGRYKCIKVDMRTKNGPLKVSIPHDILRAVGENARDIVNFCGYVVRTQAPLTTKNWPDVANRVGERMWLQVKEKFKMEDDRNEYRLCIFVLATMQRLYRGWRNHLHDLYKKFRTDEKRLANIPEDVTSEDWKYMMAYFSSDTFQKVSKRNVANRAKLVTKHTCGTRSYAEVEESIRDPEIGEKAPSD